jgi:thermostable 8-oxoguanine DNA glycosylase
MEYTQANSILKELWDVYGDSIEKEYSLFQKSKDQVLDEFFFVSLGGFGISYELNLSGLQILKNQSLLSRDYYKYKDKLGAIEEKIREQFSEKQFAPANSNGELRKYRYIESKPKIVSNAGYWLWKSCEWELYDKLLNLEAVESRLWLCTCPGIGMKSASWLLRNTGFNDDCAVFDVHILRFLNYLGFYVPKQLTERMYLNLEEALRKVCNKVGVTLGKMDYLLWLLSRNGFLNYADRGEGN